MTLQKILITSLIGAWFSFLPLYCQLDNPTEVLWGGDFFGKFKTSDHEEYGRISFWDLNLGVSRARSFNPPFPYKVIPKLSHTDSLARVNSFFYGIRASSLIVAENWDDLKTRYYAIGLEIFIKYYTPINLFVESSFGARYGLYQAWEVDKIHNNIWYTPSLKEFSLIISFALGYSFQLKGGTMIEPRIFYSLAYINTQYPNNPKINNFQSSINFRLALIFINRQIN